MSTGELSLGPYKFIVLFFVELVLFFVEQMITGDETGKHQRRMLLM